MKCRVASLPPSPHGLLQENPDKPDRPINSLKWCYQLTPAALKLLTSVGTTTQQLLGKLKCGSQIRRIT